MTNLLMVTKIILFHRHQTFLEFISSSFIKDFLKKIPFCLQGNPSFRNLAKGVQ